MSEFKDKIAVVTGGGGGLGRTFVAALAAEGATVVVADIDLAHAEETAASVDDAGGKALAVQVDTGEPDSMASMAAEIDRELGGVDILVNNAGWRPWPAGTHYEFTDRELDSIEDWATVIRVNALGPLFCSRAVRPLMARRGGGAVVNMSSIAAYTQDLGAYGVSKMAQRGITAQLATELAPDGIRVNALAPTSMTQRGDPELYKPLLDRQLIKRFGTPADLVGPLLFFCSDRSAFITGETLLIDGGLLSRR
jgi:NAD(P)-dependent dehydrogenase (short-subunit alcohol dehydrogenase family)